jgi:AcrR family transcriptional regulator
MSKLSRAEAPAEKVAKGEFILQVAERIIRDEGFEALSVNRLVQETGFAKGTLYLYFMTRHEILASLFVRILMGWHHRLGETLTKARNYKKFCSRYIRELTHDPLFLPMLVLERRDLETGLPMRRSALHCNRCWGNRPKFSKTHWI